MSVHISTHTYIYIHINIQKIKYVCMLTKEMFALYTTVVKIVQPTLATKYNNYQS